MTRVGRNMARILLSKGTSVLGAERGLRNSLFRLDGCDFGATSDR